MMRTFTLRMLALVATMLLTFTTAQAGDGTKANPYTVAELNAQKDALAASGDKVWVKADLKGLGEDGTRIDNTGGLAGLFGDATGTFVAYSHQILGDLALDDLTNTKDLLIALTYGTEGHPYGNTASPQYASNKEPTDPHFSLDEVHGALSLDISDGLRGYHIQSCYVVPKDVIAVKVAAGYNSSKGAYVEYHNFDGMENTFVTPKNAALVLMAAPGTHDFVLSAALYEQTFSNGNAMNPGTQAGENKGTTTNRARYRFVGDVTRVGFERNSQENCTVILGAKDEVFLQVSSLETNFMGNYEFETPDKNWISWKGGQYSDYHEASTTTTVTFDFANNNMGLPFGQPGTYVEQSLGDLGGKSVTVDGVTLKFVNSMTMPTRYYNNTERGKQLQLINGGQMRVTAPAGYAVTALRSIPNPGWNNATQEVTYQVAWSITKGGGTLSTNKYDWTGNAESLLLTSTGATYLNSLEVDFAPVNAETALLVNESADVYTDISGLKAFGEAANNALVKLTLTDAVITSGMVNQWGYYVQDAEAGANIYCTGLDFEVGDVLNGVVYVKKNNQTMGTRICMTEATSSEGLTITKNGTYEPIAGSVDQINVAANKCRVVKLEHVALKGTSETDATITDAAGKTIAVKNGKTNYFPYVIQESLADINYADATVVGILLGNNSGNQVAPLSITDTSAGISSVHVDATDNAVIYSVQGIRRSDLQRGLNIVNGRKVVIK